MGRARRRNDRVRAGQAGRGRDALQGCGRPLCGRLRARRGQPCRARGRVRVPPRSPRPRSGRAPAPRGADGTCSPRAPPFLWRPLTKRVPTLSDELLAFEDAERVAAEAHQEHGNPVVGPERGEQRVDHHLLVLTLVVEPERRRNGERLRRELETRAAVAVDGTAGDALEWSEPLLEVRPADVTHSARDPAASCGGSRGASGARGLPRRPCAPPRRKPRRRPPGR